MAQATTIAGMPNAVGASRARLVLRLAGAIDKMRKSFGTMFGSYRPELHYMRGPGPKWREKHSETGTGLQAP